MLNRILRYIILLVFILVFRNGLAFTILFFGVCLVIFARQAILPIRNNRDFVRSIFQLFLFNLALNGPTAKIVEGRFEQGRGLRFPGSGAALLDINSAMVLERVVPTGLLAIIKRTPREISRWISNLINRILRLPPLQPDAPVRVCGPGLTFIDFDERIQGVTELDINDTNNEPVETVTGLVDLRRQFRRSGRGSDGLQSINDTSVRAYTHDGIELGTTVNSLFTIGQDVNKAPHVLHVSFEGESAADWKAENLRVLNFQEQDGSVRIQNMTDELDEEDRNEIFQYFKIWINQGIFLPYQPLPNDQIPPTFNPNRVFSAVYSQVYQRDRQSKILPWTDLPVHQAKDIFRELLSRVNFNELYTYQSNGVLGINNLRKQLRIRMRNSGMLSYRLVLRGARSRLPRIGPTYPFEGLITSPVRALITPHVLRERGIQIITAGFAPLLPANDIYLQWLKNWRAEWERETMTANAINDLEARRIYNRARIHKQQELATSLRAIFEDTTNTKEVIAIRLLQALESIAADQDTRRLLPAETISLLQSIHSWLLPGEFGFIR